MFFQTSGAVALVGLVILAGSSACYAEGERKIGVTVIDRLQDAEQWSRVIRNVLPKASILAYAEPVDRGASDAIDRTERALKYLVRAEWGTRTGVATTEENGKAVSVTQWKTRSGGNGEQARFLWARDKHYLISIEVDENVFGSRDEIRRFLNGTIRDEKNILGIQAIHFWKAKEDNEYGIVGVGFVDYLRAPAGAREDASFQIIAWKERDRFFLSLKIGRRILEKFLVSGDSPPSKKLTNKKVGSSGEKKTNP